MTGKTVREENVASVLGTSVSLPAVFLPSSFGHLLYTPPDLAQLIRKENGDSKEGFGGATLNEKKLFVMSELTDGLFKDFGNEQVTGDKISPADPALRFIMTYASPTAGPQAAGSTTAGLTISTTAGHKLVDVPLYCSQILLQKPAAVMGLADEIPIFSSGSNRKSKAIQRTTQWHTDLVEKLKEAAGDNAPSVIPVILHDPKYEPSFKNAVEQALTINSKMVCVGGLYLNETAEQRVSVLRRVRELVGDSVVIMVQCVRTYDEMVEAVEAGVDIVTTNYTKNLMMAARAMHTTEEEPPQSVPLGGVSDAEKKESNEDVDAEPSAKRARTEVVSALSSAVAGLDEADVEDNNAGGTLGGGVERFAKLVRTVLDFPDQMSIDMFDTKYARDPRPLLKDCQCHACKHHTRAYIHHLLKSNELLADVLLYQHNQHNLLELFNQFANTSKEA